MEGHDVNVRRLGKPPLYDGTENAWSDWSFGTRACLDTLLSNPITLAELTAPRAALSRKKALCADHVLEGVPGETGWNARHPAGKRSCIRSWDQQPSRRTCVASRQHSRTGSSSSSSGDHGGGHLEQRCKETNFDRMRKQLLLRDTPLRGAIVEYLPNFREWCSAVAAAQDDPMEMDVDGITAQGKPRQGQWEWSRLQRGPPKICWPRSARKPGMLDMWGRGTPCPRPVGMHQPHRESMPKANARPSTMARKGKERRCRARVKKCWK